MTRDQLLADLRRALEARGGEDTAEMVREVERRVPAEGADPIGEEPQVAHAAFVAAIEAAVREAFPDRAARILEDVEQRSAARVAALSEMFYSQTESVARRGEDALATARDPRSINRFLRAFQYLPLPRSARVPAELQRALSPYLSAEAIARVMEAAGPHDGGGRAAGERVLLEALLASGDASSGALALFAPDLLTDAETRTWIVEQLGARATGSWRATLALAEIVATQGEMGARAAEILVKRSDPRVAPALLVRLRGQGTEIGFTRDGVAGWGYRNDTEIDVTIGLLEKLLRGSAGAGVEQKLLDEIAALDGLTRPTFTPNFPGDDYDGEEPVNLDELRAAALEAKHRTHRG